MRAITKNTRRVTALTLAAALAQTVCTPRVCGVAVVCEGGGDVRVAARITELVGALLDVPSNRICVEQRRE